jgi:hypothetical protein
MKIRIMDILTLGKIAPSDQKSRLWERIGSAAWFTGGEFTPPEGL